MDVKGCCGLVKVMFVKERWQVAFTVLLVCDVHGLYVMSACGDTVS